MHLVRTEVPSYTKGWQDLAGSGVGGGRSQSFAGVEREVMNCPGSHRGPVRSIGLFKHRLLLKDMYSSGWKTIWTQQKEDMVSVGVDRPSLYKGAGRQV